MLKKFNIAHPINSDNFFVMDNNNENRVYPFDYQVELGECLRHHRMEAGWSLEDMVKILNRAFKPNPPISFWQLRQLEVPPLKRVDPPTSLLIWLCALACNRPETGYLKNPATGKPFTDYDLIKIARGDLDWKTGQPTQRCLLCSLLEVDQSPGTDRID